MENQDEHITVRVRRVSVIGILEVREAKFSSE